MNTREVEKRIKKLPRHLVPEVVDFIEFLISKHNPESDTEAPKATFKFDWEGGLSEMKGKYSSVDLQHKSLDWR